MVDYASDLFNCRSKLLLSYFGEYDSKACGQCDICLRKDKSKLSSNEYEEIKRDILTAIHSKALTMSELKSLLNHDENKIIEVLRFLLDNQLVEQNKKHKFQRI